MVERTLVLREPKSGAGALRVRYSIEDERELTGRVLAVESLEIEPQDTLPEAARQAILANEFRVPIAGGHIVDSLGKYYDGVYFALEALARFEGLILEAEPPDLSQCRAYRSGAVM